MATIIIITPPPKKQPKSAKLTQQPTVQTFSLEGYDEATAYQILMAAAAQIENEQT